MTRIFPDRVDTGNGVEADAGTTGALGGDPADHREAAPGEPPELDPR